MGCSLRGATSTKGETLKTGGGGGVQLLRGIIAVARGEGKGFEK